MLKNKHGLTIIELLVVCCMILILIGTFGIYLNKILLESRETVLRSELLNLRASLKLYKILRNKNPEGIKDFFIYEKERADREGYLLDPFKNRYIYNPDKSKIRSSTKGYENW